MDLFQTDGASNLERRIDKLEHLALERGLVVADGAPSMVPQKRRHREVPRVHQWPPCKARSVARTVLVIDDDDAIRQLLRALLEREGFEVEEAADGQEGIERHRNHPADIVITDIIMPNKDGVNTMFELLKMTPNLKIIAMSGGGWQVKEIDFDIAKRLGAHTIEKPIRREILLEAIQKIQHDAPVVAHRPSFHCH
jgi:two-component system, chemotaxis family, chemotaxis protein CheY